MIKLLKTTISVIILVCMFLPISQCSMKTKGLVNPDTGEIVEPPETISETIVVSDTLLDEEREFSLENLVLPMAFIFPLILSLLPNFMGWRRVIKYVIQFIFSAWFVYSSYLLVFSFASPLIAGWLLNFSALLFLVLCSIELLLIKHTSSKTNARTVCSDGGKTRRPF